MPPFFLPIRFEVDGIQENDQPITPLAILGRRVNDDNINDDVIMIAIFECSMAIYIYPTI